MIGGEISILEECYNKHLNHSGRLNGKLIDLIGSYLSFLLLSARDLIGVLILSIRVFMTRKISVLSFWSISDRTFLLHSPPLVKLQRRFECKNRWNSRNLNFFALQIEPIIIFKMMLIILNVKRLANTNWLCDTIVSSLANHISSNCFITSNIIFSTLRM